MSFDPMTFDVVDRDLNRYLQQIDEEEMVENELEIKVYDKDYGFGRIVLHTVDGAVYLGEDVEDTLRLVEDFIRERMGKA